MLLIGGGYNKAMSEISLEAQIGENLRERALYLATAESCTGGLIGDRITNVPGSSDYFLGGIIAYANPIKQQLLGVKAETLERFGAVSRETVVEMAQGACRVLDTQLAVAVSGIAGPGGGTVEKPVGLVWIGLSAPDGDSAWRFILPGDRRQVKEESAEQALRLLLEYLQIK
jgi:PncC family amidohydrolase